MGMARKKCYRPRIAMLCCVEISKRKNIIIHHGRKPMMKGLTMFANIIYVDQGSDIFNEVENTYKKYGYSSGVACYVLRPCWIMVEISRRKKS